MSGLPAGVAFAWQRRGASSIKGVQVAWASSKDDTRARAAVLGLGTAAQTRALPTVSVVLVVIQQVLGFLGDAVDFVLDRGLGTVSRALVLEVVVADEAAGGLLEAALALVRILIAHRVSFNRDCHNHPSES